MMASKLYSQFVVPEQDLLAFSPTELRETVANFDSARQHLMELEPDRQ